jgi:phage baseplate assembly protein W
VTPALDFPFGIAGSGRVGTTGDDDHVRDMIEQVLLTSPGERVNLPEFGCGLRQIVFEPLSAALVATTRFHVEGALERWLGDVIQLEGVELEADDGRLMVTVTYARREDGRRREDRFFGPLVGLGQA